MRKNKKSTISKSTISTLLICLFLSMIVLASAEEPAQLAFDYTFDSEKEARILDLTADVKGVVT